MSLQYFEEKNIFIKMSFYLFYLNIVGVPILCAKILCVNWALGRKGKTCYKEKLLFFKKKQSVSIYITTFFIKEGQRNNISVNESFTS